MKAAGPVRVASELTRALDAGAAATTVVLLGMVALGLGGPVRMAAAVVFVTFVPGWALLGQVSLADGADRVAVAVALSLTIGTVATVVALWLHLWHPAALLAVLGGLSLLGLFGDLVHTRRNVR